MLDKSLIAGYNEFRVARSRENRSAETDTSVACHAPFMSMNFEQNGHATACCYNRTHVLGTYPEHSVSDMWFGGKADELREAIKDLDFSKGCELCLVQLQSRNFAGTRMLQFDHLAAQQPARRPAYPRLMEFEMTNICNLECVMCNGYYSSLIRKHREKLPPLKSPYDSAFVEQLEPFLPHLVEAKFLGGEPFLIQIYWDIWHRFLEVNPKVTIPVTTNGTQLTDKVKSIMGALDFRMILSMDSLVRDTYQGIRKRADYDVVMNSLRYFLDYMHAKGEPLWLAVCPMQQNWHEIPDMLTFCNDNGARLIFNTVLYPESCSLRSLSGDALDEILARYKAVTPTTENVRQQQNREAFMDLIHQLEQWRQIAHDKETISTQLADGTDVTVLATSDWSLATHDEARAELQLAEQSGQPLRLEIESVPGDQAWHVQLIHELPLASDVRYAMRFRAKSDAPRSMFVAVGMSTDPYTNLGLYQELALTSEWQTFDANFFSTQTTDHARIYFELGAEPSSVEFADLVLAQGAATSTALYESRYL